MKILVTSIGTRGDMEPFLAIGEIFKSKGHEVTCLFPEQFRNLAEDSGFAFESLGTEFIEMLNSETGKFALGGAGTTWQKLRAYFSLAKLQSKINWKMIAIQKEVINSLKPDRIIHNGKVVYPVIWEVNHPNTTTFISPVPYLHYVKGHSHLAFHRNFGSFINKLTFKLADWGLTTLIMKSMKKLQIKNISKSQIKTVLKEHQVIYTISPQLFPRPMEWSKNLNVLGYYERTKTNHWKPNQSILDFLEKNSKPLFVTFGSMTNPYPAEKTAIILDVLERNNISAILNTAAGGLKEPDTYNKDLFLFVDQIPYDWVFPKVSAIVHHGGSGTTHTALKYGCPNMIIPHIIDQFVWNKTIEKIGAGPLGNTISKLSRANLEPLILDLIQNPNYKNSTLSIAAKMAKENLENELYQNIIDRD